MRLTLTCLSPLSHGSFGVSAGNATLIRRMPIYLDGEGIVEIPSVSANALRGCLRRIIMRDLFRRAGLSRAGFVAAGKARAWNLLYAALANGGHLTGSEKESKADDIRALREALPPLSVLGAAMYTYFIPSHVSIGWLWPRCQETAQARLIDADLPQALPRVEDLVAEAGFCRHVDRAEQDTTETGVTSMPTTVEVLVPGTVLESDVHFAPHVSPLEQAVIGYGLDQVQTIGAKSAGGLGRVRVEHGIDPAPYLEWLETAPLTETLTELADALAARGGKKTKKKRKKADG